jgi:probable phosphoglycerate mutase
MASPGSLELWLVRHGETPASLSRTLAGRTDVPLTAHGEDQARALRPLLAGRSFEGVWSSDLQRALHTARLAWGEPRVDGRLREMGFGELEGAAYGAIDPALQQRLTRFEGFQAPGGETFAELRSRVLAFVAGLTPGPHLVFTHGGVVRALSREAGEDYFVPTGSLLVLDWPGRRLIFRRDGEGDASRGLPTPQTTQAGPDSTPVQRRGGERT